MEKKTQHRFAQTYFGLNTQIIPSQGSMVWNGATYAFPAKVSPRFTIGGLHFWGKLDFNINFPLMGFGSTGLPDDGDVRFSTGADLSARYYPWRLSDKKIRPFAGISFNAMQLSLESVSQGERSEGFITSSVLAGLSYSHNGWQINTEMMFLPQNSRDFYSNTRQKHRFNLPNSYFSFGIVKFFDFTLNEEEPMLSGKTRELEERLLREGNLNSLSIGVAANGSHFFRAPYFSEDLRSLPRHKGSINMEYSLGYLFHEKQMHVGLTYRTYSSNSLSYELEHIVRREALSLEGFKFVWDYNGFVPFIGMSLSAERWAMGLFVNDVQQGNTSRSRILSPGLIFGWDIRPSPLDTWVLRTNLRYYPYQEIDDGRSKSWVDQFEFNFIQFVFYPNRWLKIRKAKGLS